MMDNSCKLSFQLFHYSILYILRLLFTHFLFNYNCYMFVYKKQFNVVVFDAEVVVDTFDIVLLFYQLVYIMYPNHLINKRMYWFLVETYSLILSYLYRIH